MTSKTPGSGEGPGNGPTTNPDHKTYSIHIDKKLYKAEADGLTGAQLRALADPPIGMDRDLYLVVPGGNDILVEDDDVIDLREGQHFVSAPRDVTPGAVSGGC